MGASKKVGTWDQLKMSPAQLMKLVIQGKANIIGRGGLIAPEIAEVLLYPSS